MNQSENNLMKSIMLKLGSISGVRIFRNNSGKCWVGKSAVMHERRQIWVNKGDVIIENGRFFNAGLCVGSSDLIGLKSVEVTQDMVGSKIAVFVATEVKTATGRVSPEQLRFIEMVNSLGGIGFVAKSDDEAVNFINKK